MKFVIEADNGGRALFYSEGGVLPGVERIADRVRKDIGLVTGRMPAKTGNKTELTANAVIYGTIGSSRLLESLEASGEAVFDDIRGKREVYKFIFIENPSIMPEVKCALVIAGSDKRGTIYGLFHLSELMGVSPLTEWSDAVPVRRKEIVLTKADEIVSREPSVKYRGFFINDEWPAFGTWTTNRFGGFNAKMYEHVFELLLRLKGNYLWPAMWSSCFSEDGPGLESARLADEYGVIIGTSHHEPCMRNGEEYKHLRGKDSIYGDAWNFRTNSEGITAFWRDGLKRNGKFDNIITVGMRGEQDTAIMGEHATLADNIELLRDVLHVQNDLIKEYVNPNLDEVPRMLALYKEVEPYFYGDASNEGLMNSSELEGVTLMLCDDNNGNLRTLPAEDMRDHKGGYGMYYHFDYHGEPVSFEWINTTHLSKVWEQMTMAYDFGVRELWIVNVGDICTQEFPLSYFMDMAYDFDTWGTKAPNSFESYTRQWVEKQFPQMSQDCICDTCRVIDTYTRLSHYRRTEAITPDTFHPANYCEGDRILAETEWVLEKAEKLLDSSISDYNSFYELVYYPSAGTMNVLKMQLLAGKNHYYAMQGRVGANSLADRVKDCIEFDRELVKEFHSLNNGKWLGMGLSEHIGFTHWVEEENHYPVMSYIEPASKPRIIVGVCGTDIVTSGLPWTGKALYINGFKDSSVERTAFEISSGSGNPVGYEISCDCKWLSLSSYGGQVTDTDIVYVYIDRNVPTNGQMANIRITAPGTAVVIKVDGDACEAQDYVILEATDYCENTGAGNAAFCELKNFGRTGHGMKVFPTTSFFKLPDAPCLTYRFNVKAAGMYKAEIYMAPGNPVNNNNKLQYGIAVNDSAISLTDAVPDDYRVGANPSMWAENVLDNIRIQTLSIECRMGMNELRLYAVTPAFVPERIIIYPAEYQLAQSYLGPYRI